jgi:hypothetical protein
MAVLKKGMGPTKKTKLFLRLKSKNNVQNTKKFDGPPFFYVQIRKQFLKTVYQTSPYCSILPIKILPVLRIFKILCFIAYSFISLLFPNLSSSSVLLYINKYLFIS